jgi:hypothetical protein
MHRPIMAKNVFSDRERTMGVPWAYRKRTVSWSCTNGDALSYKEGAVRQIALNCLSSGLKPLGATITTAAVAHIGSVCADTLLLPPPCKIPTYQSPGAGPGLFPGHFMWDVGCKKWRGERFAIEHHGYPSWVSFHQCCVHSLAIILHSSEGHAGEAWSTGYNSTVT